jgi:hypothetical protein
VVYGEGGGKNLIDAARDEDFGLQGGGLGWSGGVDLWKVTYAVLASCLRHVGGKVTAGICCGGREVSMSLSSI